MAKGNRNHKRWTTVFRALANVNRLKIIVMLSEGPAMHVGQIADELEISLKATSNHLAILKRLDVVDAKGMNGHVFYSLGANMPEDFRILIKLV
ncbi:MAG: ArsR family transcriptional regulator [Patescibacteria group bacterium]|nr:ArsR family transcriptional regulator [Patescibacteria group bacterium]